MKNLNFKILAPHLIAVIIFYVLTAAYFSPLIFDKKAIKQSDVSQYKGMSKEIEGHRKQYGEEPLWTNSMFGGMPSYQISTKYPGNLMPNIDKIFKGIFLPQPAFYYFSCMLGFYFLMLVLGMDVWLAVLGAIIFALSTYFLIIIEAGHNTKAGAISYMAPTIAGIIMAYRGRIFAGAAVTALFLALELSQNHFQITYYLFLTIALYVFFEFIEAIKSNSYLSFAKASGMIAIAAILAIGPNITNILLTEEYGKSTTRGKSELTNDPKNQTSGLDKDYATGWSFDKAEVFTLLMPNFFGGASGVLGNDKDAMKDVDPNLRQYISNVNSYYGNQPFTSGPTYAGAIVCFLFVLALLIVEGPIKWGFLAATILSIMLSWGKNFMELSDLFFDYFPGYNKFRTVTMILVIAELTMPALAILAIKKIMDVPNVLVEKQKQFLIAFGLTGGLCLLFWMMPDLFMTYWGEGEQANLLKQLKDAQWPEAQVSGFLANVEIARKSLFTSDAIRSFVLILLSALSLKAYSMGKVNRNLAIGIIGFLCLVDLWPVNRRYLNKDNFVPKSNMDIPFTASAADEQILADKDPSYRVFNLSVSPFNDASTSYFHKSIGGYHGAKLKRYQELIENHISKNNMSVINMLNTKYFIVENKQTNEPMVQLNSEANGSAWIVSNYKIVENADSELKALTNFDSKNLAVIDKRFQGQVSTYKPHKDSLATLKLDSYKANHLKYSFNGTQPELAIFSEIYYQPGWNAYVDGKLSEHFRTNYILRGMIIPTGKHLVEFKFEPATYKTGQTIAYASSGLIFLFIAGAFFMEYRKKEEN